MILTLEGSIGLKCSTFNVGQGNNGWSWIDRCQSQIMPIPNVDIYG